ncbi:1555_t:CDS:1, partial [Acaulospora colombiana]
TPNDQSKKSSTPNTQIKPMFDLGHKPTFGTLGDHKKEHSTPVASTKSTFELTFGDLTNKPSNEPESNKLTFGMIPSAATAPDNQIKKPSPSSSSASTKPALNFGTSVTSDDQIIKTTPATLTKPAFAPKSEPALTPGDQTKRVSTPFGRIQNFGTSGDQIASNSTNLHFDFGNKFTHPSPAASSELSSVGKIKGIIPKNDDNRVDKNEDTSKTLNYETSKATETAGSTKGQTLTESKTDETLVKSNKGEIMPESKKGETALGSNKDEIPLGSNKNDTTLDLKKGETTTEVNKDDATGEVNKDEKPAGLKKNDVALESKKGETAIESTDSENGIEPKKDGVFDLSKGSNLSSMVTNSSKGTIGDDKSKEFSFVFSNNPPQTLTSSPLSGSPMDIDMNNANNQVSVPSTLSFTSTPFGQSFEGNLGKNFAFSSNQSFNVFNPVEISSSTEIPSNYNSKSRMQSFRKRGGKRAYESTGNEGRNVLLAPKTAPSEGQSSNLMMMPGSSSFTFQLGSQKAELPTIPTQPTTSPGIFKFSMPGNHEMSDNQIANPFLKNI